MAIIGRDTASGTTQGRGGNQFVAEKFSVPENGFISGVSALSGGFNGAATTGRVGLYQGSDGVRLQASAAASWGPTLAWRTHSFTPMKFDAGQTIYVGVQATSSFTLDIGPFLADAPYIRKNVTDLPVDADDGSIAENGYDFAWYATYTPNAAPLAGAWRGATPTSGGLAPLTPTFEGTTPHPAADSGPDYTTEVHLQVYRVSNGAMAYDALFSTTSTEQASDTFSRAPVQLIGSTTYRARFRHRDRFGVYSPFSPETEFTTTEGPNPPEGRVPSGKINVLGGYNYQTLYTHPGGLNANAWQVRVTNPTGTTILYTSVEVAISPTAASGSILSMLEFHVDLAWATGYAFQARV